MSARRQWPGFEAKHAYAGSVQRVKVTIEAAYIDGLWRQAEHAGTLSHAFRPDDVRDAEYFGAVGHYRLWKRADGSTWGVFGSLGVLVVKPESSES